MDVGFGSEYSILSFSPAGYFSKYVTLDGLRTRRNHFYCLDGSLLGIALSSARRFRTLLEKWSLLGSFAMMGRKKANEDIVYSEEW